MLVIKVRNTSGSGITVGGANLAAGETRYYGLSAGNAYEEGNGLVVNNALVATTNLEVQLGTLAKNGSFNVFDV